MTTQPAFIDGFDRQCSLVWICLGAVTAQAQLRLNLTGTEKFFLAYEPVPVRLEIENFTGTLLALGQEPHTDWLRLRVTTEEGTLVPATAEAMKSPVLDIPAGRQAVVDINVSRFFAAREPGTYFVQAVVNLGPGEEFTSPYVSSDISPGQTIWSQKIGFTSAGKRQAPLPPHETGAWSLYAPLPAGRRRRESIDLRGL